MRFLRQDCKFFCDDEGRCLKKHRGNCKRCKHYQSTDLLLQTVVKDFNHIYSEDADMDLAKVLKQYKYA